MLNLTDADIASNEANLCERLLRMVKGFLNRRATPPPLAPERLASRLEINISYPGGRMDISSVGEVLADNQVSLTAKQSKL